MIIGVLGFEGAGKNTFAELVADKIDAELYEISTPLKGLLNDLLGETKHSSVYYKTAQHKNKEITDKHLHHLVSRINGLGEILSSHFPRTEVPKSVVRQWGNSIINFVSERRTYRELVQFIGTDCMRTTDNRVHLREIPYSCSGVTIIPDVRFKNEIELCDHLVHIRHPDIGPVNSHISTREWVEHLNHFEHSIVFNSSDIETLAIQADKYLRLIGVLI